MAGGYENFWFYVVVVVVATVAIVATVNGGDCSISKIRVFDLYRERNLLRMYGYIRCDIEDVME